MEELTKIIEANFNGYKLYYVTIERGAALPPIGVYIMRACAADAISAACKRLNGRYYSNVGAEEVK